VTGASPTRAFVGLGANLGDAAAALQAAVRDLDALPQTRVVARSSLWRSAPVDAPGPEFVNAVVELATVLDARTLLQALHRIEHARGRERPYRNAPRTLDLDLLLYGDQVIDEPGLVVPHPRMHERAFVLRPLSEIAPTIDIPGRGPLAAWLARAAAQHALPIEGA
jgi:2-amino-4-hydroxy-6-hydroxymethyldihydropteridine diphosphokinase